MIVNVYFYGLQNSHHPLLEVYAHDFRNNKSQKKTPAASDRCSTINYLFFIKTNTEFLNSNSPNWKLYLSILFSSIPFRAFLTNIEITAVSTGCQCFCPMQHPAHHVHRNIIHLTHVRNKFTVSQFSAKFT